MNLTGAIALMMIAGCVLQNAAAQLEVLTPATPVAVFSGAGRDIPLTLHNADNQSFNHRVRARLFQTTSASAISLGDSPWKQLQVLPRQTVVDAARLDFPVVKAETELVIQWLDDANHVLGQTSILIYPTNLLHALQPFLCQTNFGVFDPGNQIKPLLRAQGVSFTDIGENGFARFCGRLAIIGPFQSAAQMPPDLASLVKKLAQKNVAVVWIRPPSPPALLPRSGWERKQIQPSFYCVQKYQTTVVVVQPDLVSSLRENPQSQIALIYFCNLALNPLPATLPGLTSDADP